MTVNGIAPSMTETKFLSALADLTVEMNAKSNPLGRNARPQDIAPTAWHLLDDAALRTRYLAAPTPERMAILAEILRLNDIQSVTVVRMEVPCCGGIEHAVKSALLNSGKMIPWQVVTIATDGTILD